MGNAHDVLIVGAGTAGLRAAVKLVAAADVAVVSKVYPTRSHSGLALGNEAEDRSEGRAVLPLPTAASGPPLPARRESDAL